MKTLVIAEKPSVAQDIVRALSPLAGCFDKHEDHFENEQYVVTSAVGHLLEISCLHCLRWLQRKTHSEVSGLLVCHRIGFRLFFFGMIPDDQMDTAMTGRVGTSSGLRERIDG